MGFLVLFAQHIQMKMVKIAGAGDLLAGRVKAVYYYIYASDT